MGRERTRWRGFRLLLSRARIAEEVDEELAFHLDRRAAELEREGLSPEAAREEAERRFGDRERVRRECIDLDRKRVQAMKRREWFNGLKGDVRFSARSLRRSPAFSLTVIATLALCIGATTVIFGVVDGVLLKPLPFAAPERLVRVYQSSPENGITRSPVSFPDVQDWRARDHDFQSLGAFFYSEGLTGVDLTGAGPPQRLSAAYVDGSFFPTLGTSPQLGRWPAKDEQIPGHDQVVVLSAAAWRRLLNGAPDPVGRTLTLEGKPFTVIGVLPDRFPVPGERVDVYLPLSLITEDQVGHGRQSRWLGVVGRLAPGVDLSRAATSLDRIAGALAKEHAEDRAFNHAQLLSLHESVVGAVRAPLLLVLCAVSLILLIACVNIANLMLARAAGRQHELTVRSALGASRWHLARQLLVETLTLSLTGGALGVALAALSLPVARSLSRAMVPRLDDVRLSVEVLGVAAAVSIATGVLFALAPALLGSAATRYESLRAARTASAGGLKARSALVVAEIALAVILVAGASLASRSMWALTRVDLGFQPQGATVVSYHAHADNSEGIAQRHREILQAVRALPGVTQVGGAKELPLEAMGEDTAFSLPGRPPPAPGAEPHANVLHVTPAFFEALGIPLLRGSGFPPHDPPAFATFLCNETFARQYLGGLDGAGRSIHIYGMDMPVVGIVGDARQARLGEPAPALLYINMLENPRSLINLVIRGNAPPLELTREVRKAIASIDPEQTLDRVTSMEQIVDDALAPPRLVTVVMVVLGLLGLLLGAIGIFGVLAYFVGQRRRELAIRLALGAQREVLLRSVLGRGLALAAVGIGVGLVATLVATSVAGSLLYGLAAQDPPTLAFVCVLLLAVAAIASYLPARRATRVDPAEALRAE